MDAAVVSSIAVDTVDAFSACKDVSSAGVEVAVPSSTAVVNAEASRTEVSISSGQPELTVEQHFETKLKSLVETEDYAVAAPDQRI